MYKETIKEMKWLNGNPDPSKCHCRGGGYFLSPFDTWEDCPAHIMKKGIRQMDPESLGWLSYKASDGDLFAQKCLDDYLKSLQEGIKETENNQELEDVNEDEIPF